MTIEREVTIAGQTYPVILSDENEALQAAKAAGRAIVGLWRENEEKQPADYSSCLYLITDPEDADETFLERVVRRYLALPWLIAEHTCSYGWERKRSSFPLPVCTGWRKASSVRLQRRIYLDCTGT